MDSGRHISKHGDRCLLAEFETLYPIGAIVNPRSVSTQRNIGAELIELVTDGERRPGVRNQAQAIVGGSYGDSCSCIEALNQPHDDIRNPEGS
jgi:hypothetical protein